MASAGVIILIWFSSLVLAQDEVRRPLGPVQPGPPPPPPPVGCRGGFSVRKADTSNLATGHRIRFQNILTNTGGWSQFSSQFIAPCDGVYFFTFHAVSSQKKDFTMALMKNNVYQVTAYGSEDDYQHASNSVMLVLDKGDRVHLELQDGRIYEHPFNEAYTTFTGFLVEKI